MRDKSERFVVEFIYGGKKYIWDNVNKVYWEDGTCYFEYGLPKNATIVKTVRKGCL